MFFDFIRDMGNYDERCVGRYDNDDLMVSTARVSDGAQPYETAVAHPKYNDGDMVIVEAYDSGGEAKAGHERWVATMTNGKLPTQLTNCCNAGVSQMLDAVGGNVVFPRKQ